MIDSHCHLAFDVYHDRIDQIISDARDAGVQGMMTVSTTTGDIHANQVIAHRFQNVWYTAGVHPLHTDEPYDWEAVRAVADDPKCVAWGELGLDNHYKEPRRDIQRAVLEEQLALLERMQSEGIVKPVVVHCREAFDDLIPILASSALDPHRFVFHCFTGNTTDARNVLDFGAWISFTGVVTFQNAPEVAEAATLVPDDRFMIETDAPFLSPEPVRKIRPNEPKNVAHIARFMAKLRSTELKTFEQRVDANTKRFFGIELDEHHAS